MRKMLLGCFGLLALQAPAMAASSAACDAAAAQWRDAALSSPAKPAQLRVLGRAGHETSGPEYQTIAQAIRKACGTSDPVVARQEAAVAERLLGQKNGL
jgi:hypothetical protein